MSENNAVIDKYYCKYSMSRKQFNTVDLYYKYKLAYLGLNFEVLIHLLVKIILYVLKMVLFI